MDLNKVMIIGRLTRDPELKTTPSGANVCQIGIATNYVYVNKESGQKVEQVEYHNVVMWRKLADIAHQYLKKGAQVYIEGRLQTRSWDDKDGKKNYKTEIVADNVIMLSSKSGTGASPMGSPSPATQPASSSAAPRPQASTFVQPPQPEELPTINQDEDINVEDIPF